MLLQLLVKVAVGAYQLLSYIATQKLSLTAVGAKDQHSKLTTAKKASWWKGRRRCADCWSTILLSAWHSMISLLEVINEMAIG
jgi:hypothetical protein